MQTLRRGLVAVPEAATLAVLALTVPVGLMVTVGLFAAGPALLLGAGALLLLWRLSPPRAPERASWPASAVVLLAVAVWAAVQMRHTGEFVAVDRDPAVYALTGLWLVDHPSVAVPMTEAAAAAADVPGARTAGLGFGGSGDPLRPEFAHTLPGVLAVAGWLGGTRALLAANVVVGAVALLGTYALARRVVGAWWGLVPVVALALGMPFVAFSRITYSEPLALAMITAGAALLTSILDAEDRPRVGTAVVAGLYLGSVGLVRIDGALVVAGALAAVAAWVVLVGPARDGARTVVLGVGLPAAALVGVGMADLGLNSGTYLTRLSDQAWSLLLAMASAGAAAGLAVAFGARLSRWLRPRRDRVAASGAALAGLGSALLLSRPLWLEAQGSAGNAQLMRDIERRQAEEGLPPDGARSYDELTLEWISWYHGWPAVLAGLAGVGLMTYLAVSGRRPGVLAALLTLGAPALLYLVSPSITPDHVWAMRRLVTGAVPLVLLGVAMLLAVVGARSRPGLVGAVTAAVVLAAWPLSTWSGLFGVTERVGQLAEARAACAQVADGRVVVANGVPGVDYLPTLRVVCDAQVVALNPTTQESLAALHAAWGGRPLTLLTYDPDAMPWTRPPAEPVHRARLEMWERSLIGAPSAPTVWQRVMWAGTVGPDGRVEPR